MTIKNRLERFTYFYTKKREKAFFIFQVEGLKGSIDIKINNIHFYTLDKKRYIKNFFGKKLSKNDLEEFFLKKLTEPYINASVQIDFIDVNFGAKRAIEKINEALDIIRCFIKSKIPLKVIQNEYFVVDNNGKVINSSFSAAQDEGVFKKINSLDLNRFFKDKKSRDFLKELNKKMANDSDEFCRKLLYALHWYKKGFESNKIEDKIINYWIVIESLLTIEDLEKNKIVTDSKNIKKIDIISELLPAFEIDEYIHKIAKDLFYYLDDLANCKQGLSSMPLLTISEITLKKHKIGQKSKGTINIKEFVKAIPDLEKEEKKY